MGRLVKNTVFESGSYTVGVPNGPASVRPDSPVTGQLRYNTTINRLEFYGNVLGGVPAWNPVGSQGNVYVGVEYFSGDGANVNFTSTVVNSSWLGREAAALVHVGTVYQKPAIDYTFYGNGMVNFSSAPGLGTNNIVLVYGYATTQANIA